MYSAKTIAKNLIEFAKIEGIEDLTNMKLQKVLFFIEGMFMITYDNNPLMIEDFEAWPYGPVIPSIFQEYKLFGSDPIKVVNSRRMKSSGLDFDDYKFVKDIWDQLKSIDAYTLSKLTHIEGSPWKEAIEKGNKIIPKIKIAEFMKSLITPEPEAAAHPA
jgi:uncharacterized phage-associated protein